MNTLPFVNFHTHRPPHEGEISLGGDEYGMDRRWPTSPEEQEAEFRRRIQESERQGRHLTVHCVRALDDILRIRRETHPRMPWMLHGFRGKPQQLRSLLAAGMYVSFGPRHNTDSLLLCPADRLCIETDDTPGPVRRLYEQIARLRGVGCRELQEQMLENAGRLTQKDVPHYII